MKQFLFILVMLPFGGFAQHSLSGSVVDSERNLVPFSDVILLQKDSLVYKKSQSDERGNFILETIPTGDYILKISSIGFVEQFQNISVVRDVKLAPIMLEATSETLESVEIISKRPIVKRLVDRMEFSVENSSLSSNNAWEILSKTPGVTTASGGGISVRGSQSILVTINDKKIYMSGDDLKQFLESTSGEDVKSVEVITNPPAKYDAQGSAVVNIKMKKSNCIGIQRFCLYRLCAIDVSKRSGFYRTFLQGKKTFNQRKVYFWIWRLCE